MGKVRTVCSRIVVVLVGLWCSSYVALAEDSPTSTVPQTWSVHGQMTVVEQYHPAFRSPFRGANSLDPGSRGDETIDLTLFAGLRPWNGGEVWANPEIDQGFGLSNTLGVAGFPSGEAYKVGKATPYFRLHRLFLRQTFDLGGQPNPVPSDANQFGGDKTTENLVITFGKFSVTDVFDANSYAHDPKQDFLNWAIIESGAFDYAADSWGYSYGMSVEWTQSWWTLRGGVFDLSRIPNNTQLQRGLAQFELVAEAEERHTLWDEPGKLKILGYINRGRMGDYVNAVNEARVKHSTPDTALVRRYASRPGAAVNMEQQINDSLGMFVRLSLNDGSKEGYDFTEINRSISVGISLKGADWGRPNDTIGFAAAVNGLSDSARAYFAAGGIGILIGDGSLVHSATEDIVEIYYSAQLNEWVSVSADYQFVANPAYNRDRGPVSIFGARVHAHI